MKEKLKEMKIYLKKIIIDNIIVMVLSFIGMLISIYFLEKGYNAFWFSLLFVNYGIFMYNVTEIILYKKRKK